MTLAETLRDAALRLQKAESDDARLEAEVLLCHVLGLGREKLFAQLQEFVCTKMVVFGYTSPVSIDHCRPF